MEYLIETLERLNEQKACIRKAALTRAHMSDLSAEEITDLADGLDDLLDDAFDARANPLQEELEEQCAIRAGRELRSDILAYQRSVL